MGSDDGFTLVNRQRKRKGKSSSNSLSQNYKPIDMVNEIVPHNYHEFVDKLRSRLQKCIQYLDTSRFTDQVVHCLTRNGVKEAKSSTNVDPVECIATDLANFSLNHFNQVVSYGIGRFSSSRDALYQLALLFTLKTDSILTADDWLIYDPIFIDYEKRFLTENGFKVAEVNDKGGKSITGRTLFYMPHCPIPMYNNLLWANWSPTKLNQLIILGTSFNFLTNSFISIHKQTEYSYITTISDAKLVDEYHLDPPRDIFEAFNDLSVQFFTQINGMNLPNGTNCDPRDTPIYSDDVFSKEMIVN